MALVNNHNLNNNEPQSNQKNQSKTQHIGSQNYKTIQQQPNEKENKLAHKD
jgi:hypothetical protein